MPRQITGRPCTIGDCKRELYAKGQCEMHYRRFRKHGTFEDPKPTFEQRFWANVDKSGNCWVWTGCKSDTGYGTTSINGVAMNAHRVSYKMFHGPIPDGRFIDHICRNRSCVNPEHLRVATSKQNMENLSGAKCTSKSGIRGVYPRGDGKWQVQVTHNRKVYNGGSFISLSKAEEAAISLRNELYTHNELDRQAA